MNILPASRSTFAPVTLGDGDVDARLGGGLARSALHELHGDDDDGSAATGFTFLLALRAAGPKPIVMVRDDRVVRACGRLHGDGIAALGGDPAKLLLIHTGDVVGTLRAAGDAVACAAIGAVIIQPWRAAPAFDLTATRRIALRAERSGVFTLVIRLGADATPSAAATRWRIRGSPSTPLAANAPGQPAFDVTLLRHRGGVTGFDARLEWNHDEQRFDHAPLPRRAPAVVTGRARAAGERRAA